MKKLFSIVALLAFAGSVYAGCPSKPIHGKVVSFDVESKTLTVAQGKKETWLGNTFFFIIMLIKVKI